MKKKGLFIILCLIVILFGMVIGLLIGMFVGGNYLTSFEFDGVRGYEAVGKIGLLIGLIMAVGICILIRRSIQKIDDK